MAVANKVSLLLRNELVSVNLCRGFNRYTVKLFAPQSGGNQSSSASSSSVPDVPGLSAKVVKVPSGKVGPGASKDSAYKHPEYFCFDLNSYYEAEIEMAKFRLPQPSNKN